MCVVSMIFDHYRDRWEPLIPVRPTLPVIIPGGPYQFPEPLPAQPLVTPEEVEEFRRLLERAREYDRKNNEPDCELDEKRKAIKRIADELGVAIDFV